MNPLGYVKDHPYLTGSLIVGSIVLFMLLRGGGSSAAASGGGDLGSIYAAQAGAQTATNQINAGLQAQSASLGAQLEDTKIRALTATNLAGLSANVELAKINATQQITDLANTLTANVAMKNIQGQTDVANINANVSINQYNRLADVLITQSRENASISRAAIEAAAAANQCHGLGCLF